MIALSKPELSEIMPCPYLKGRQARFIQFLAVNVSTLEMDKLLSQGWRKFGYTFFRPSCPNCRECIPVRIPVNHFSSSKSQRRLLRKSSDVSMVIEEPKWNGQVFDLYREHSRDRFSREVTQEEFQESFLVSSCPALQSHFYVQGELVAAGFLDRSEQALSSVYFVYRTRMLSRAIGMLSILREIEYAVGLGVAYYYLGYYVAGNHHMSYKGSFAPSETMDWGSGVWNFNSARLNCPES